MARRFVLTLLTLLACGDDLVSGDAGPAADGGSNGGNDGGVPSQNIQVRAVIDGDTIIVRAGQAVQTPDGMGPIDGVHIRLLGVDAPEIAHPPAPADCWGDQSKAFTEGRIGGRIVKLTYDPMNGYRDMFGRLLAYVELDGKIVNEALLETGHARVFPCSVFRHRTCDRYEALEDDARRARVGLWSMCP